MKKKPKLSRIQALTENQPGSLTAAQARLLRRQIRKNSIALDHCIRAIDLLANKERCPEDANTLLSLRKRLEISISENDTFRKVLWRHLQAVEPPASAAEEALHPASFLAACIKSRRYALIAQSAMK